MKHTSTSPLRIARSTSCLAIEGYGPCDLIERLRSSPWLPCVPSGSNFAGIMLGDLLLSNQPDRLCPEKYRVKVECIPTGESFTAEGYQMPHLLDTLWLSPQPVTFAGCELLDDAVGHVNAYRVTIRHFSSVDSLVTAKVQGGTPALDRKSQRQLLHVVPMALPPSMTLSQSYGCASSRLAA